MQRRTFIHLSAYTAIALTLPIIDGCGLNSTDKILSQPLFFSRLVDFKTITETGLAYRKLFPVEDNQAALNQLLLGNNASNDKKMIQKQLDEQVEQDFKAGKTVTAKGWVLSVTEARQCALYSIINT
ncbi:hypothetical protein ACPPVU_16715 [Mucilaginibacter sp. McL0603]|uniref:hypothetical protein n=1 Tax=Mucilaginibacter sp. McL0603 TaxID=3415670 RepID=UPI003CE6B531